MTTVPTPAPTPAEFLAQPYRDEEDEAPSVMADFVLSPIESIAYSLVELVEIVKRHESADSDAAYAEASYEELRHDYEVLEGERDALQVLIDEVLRICKPSTSKLANSIRAVLEPAPVVEEPSAKDPADAEKADAGDPESDGVSWSFEVVTPPEPSTEPAAPQQPGQAFELGPNASVADWRAYARMFGHTDVDQADIPAIRTLLGLPAPVEQPHNHDFRAGATPNSCACGYTLPEPTNG